MANAAAEAEAAAANAAAEGPARAMAGKAVPAEAADVRPEETDALGRWWCGVENPGHDKRPNCKNGQ